MRTPIYRLHRLLSVSALVFGVHGCKPSPAPPTHDSPNGVSSSAPKVQEAAAKTFDAYFAAHPVAATSLGEHAHDGRWPDLSPAGIGAERARIDDARTALAATRLRNVDDEVDAEILHNELDLQMFTIEVERPWVKNPYWYTNVIGAGLDDLISRDFAPIGERAAAVAGRLEALPDFITQATKNLVPKTCMRPQTKVAIEQLKGLIALIESTIPERTLEAPEDVKARIAKATKPASDALRNFRKRLKKTVLPQAKGDWRLGAENFDKKLRLTLNANVGADELRRSAVLEHGKVRQQMFTLASELAGVLFDEAQTRQIQSEAGGNAESALTKAVFEKLSAWHVAPKALRGAIELNVVRLDEFVRNSDIVPLDSAEKLEVIWTPAHQRGVFIAGLAAPGPLEVLEQGLPSFYLVQPISKAWSSEVADSFLREYNNFMLEILSVHEAIPGHFVQLYYGKREPSVVRRVLQNGAFVEGWAVYSEQLVVDAGYEGIGPPKTATRPASIDEGLWSVMVDPKLRAKAIALHGLKFYLRTVTNALLDHSIHTGKMTRQQALELMIERSFQQEGEAIGKWTRAQLTSTQLSTYFVGARAWKELRARAEARGKDTQTPFSMQEFHAAALSHGAPPVHALPRLLGWTAPKYKPGTPGADVRRKSPKRKPAREPSSAALPQ